MGEPARQLNCIPRCTVAEGKDTNLNISREFPCGVILSAEHATDWFESWEEEEEEEEEQYMYTKYDTLNTNERVH
jgi:hypothetical protein